MRTKIVTRVAALGLATVLMTVDASAAIKEIRVFGGKMINDLGQSDHHVSMDNLKKDYSGYLQTDGLTEYFHKDLVLPARVGMDEAMAWLIDNNIINRDERITVSNLRGNYSVKIDKADANEMLYRNVTRSDALMYIYKAAFGPLPGRSVGVETQNVRADGGRYDLLYNIMARYDYFNTVAQGTGLTVRQESESTKGGNGYAVGSYYAGGSGTAGSGKQETYTVNTSSKWRYTPQGDEYTTIFGDTNIFVSDIEIDQQVESGTGDFTSSTGGGGHAAGAAMGNISLETDYKQMYFLPGADVIFYDTADVLEMYLQAIEAKGLLGADMPATTEKYQRLLSFIDDSSDMFPSWSGNADPYVLNSSAIRHWRVEKVHYSPLSELLGVNYTITYQSGRQLTITRNNLFNSRSQYFVNEALSRMDAYTYIYDMIKVSEKAMSSLEADIVNYKYGMEVSGLPSARDQEIIKYLIAKGILDFDGSDELFGLYDELRWEDFIDVLYRTANKDARLDFSKVQLTDSESAWKARGFQSQTISVVDNNDVGVYTEVETTSEVSDDAVGEEETLRAVNVRNSGIIVEADAEEFTSENNYGVLKDATLETLYIRGYSLNPEVLRGTAEDLNSGNGAGIDTGYGAGGNVGNYLQSLLGGRTYTSLDQLDSVGVLKRIEENVVNNVWAIACARGSGNSIDMAGVDAFFDNLIGQLSGDEKGQQVLRGLHQRYKDNVNGDNGPKMDWLSGAGWAPFYNSQVDDIMGVGSYRVTIPDVDDKGAGKVSYVLTLTEPDSLLLTSGISEKVKALLGRDGVSALTFNITASKVEANGVELKLTKEALMTKVSNKAEANTSTSLKVQTVGENGKEAYVSRAEINKTFNGDGAPKITFITDWHLECDGREAIFLNGNGVEEGDKRPMALVGNTVIVGEHNESVAYVDAGGTGDEHVWYMTRAIYALVGVTKETYSFCKKTVAVPDEGFVDALETYGVVGASDSEIGSIKGIRALVRPAASVLSVEDADATLPRVVASSAALNTTSRLYEKMSYNNSLWSNFVEVAGTSRVGNMVCRKFISRFKENRQIAKDVYGPVDVERVVFAVLTFDVDTALWEGSSVTASTTLQGLLDAPTRPPESKEKQALYEKNKKDCNAFCNWLYGTTGGTYVNTGYLTPNITLYVQSASLNIGTSVLSALPEEYRRFAMQNVQNMVQIFYGRVLPRSQGISAMSDADYAKIANSPVQYWVSNDLKVLISGDTVFLNEGCLDNVSFQHVGGKSSYVSKPGVGSSALFSIGTSFTVGDADYDGDGRPGVVGVVSSTTEDGYVICQMGPVAGIPAIVNGSKMVIAAGSTGVVSELKATYDSTNTTDNLLLKSFTNAFMLNRSATVNGGRATYEGVTTEPTLTGIPSNRANSMGVLVFNGSQIQQYSRSGADGSVTMSKSLPDVGSKTTSQYMSDIHSLFGGVIFSGSKINTFYTVKFSATDYKVENGRLVLSTLKTSDYITPAFLESINSILLDNLATSAKNPIPINEVPEGSLVDIGEGNFYTIGTDAASKEFVGFAKLETQYGPPTMVDAGLAFKGHTIKAGSQMLNISHFFSKFSLLSNERGVGGSENYRTEAQKSALEAVAQHDFDSPNNEHVWVYQEGFSNVDPVAKTDVRSTKRYAGVSIKFQDYLLAYKDETAAGDIPVYRIVDYAVSNNGTSAVSGAFENVTLFNDSVMTCGIAEQPGEFIASNYQAINMLESVKDQLKVDFRKAFAGDLITLARMLLFLVLMWLAVASWVCYAARLSNILPILDAIKYPSGNRQSRGLDLFKLVSLGTINLETEFTLGKFIQYNAILAGLLFIVMVSGRIQI